MTLTEALAEAKLATTENLSQIQQTLYSQIVDLSETELEQVFGALKRASGISLKALRIDWESYLKANGLASGSQYSSEPIADVLVRLALASGLELWHDLERNPWATIKVSEHQEHHPLKNKAVKRFLAKLYLDNHSKAAPSQAIQDALNSLEAQAVFKGSMYPTFVRVAYHEGNIYLDLCNENWDAVEVTPSGWTVLPSTQIPVRFRRASGLAPLPKPTKGGTLDDLAPLTNLEPTSSTWRLLVAWLLGSLQPRARPFPVIVVAGQQGSGKSTTARMLKNLVDPNVSPLRVLPKEERDLLIMAVNGHVLAFDNLSGLSPAISDSLCRLSTGGGFSVRQLYSDSEETLLDAMRPIVLNGIDDFVKRQDLADRSILVNLPAIPDEKRKTEAEIWANYESLRPSLLGALLEAVSYALAHQDKVHLPTKPRLADFAVWVTAAEPSLGWETGEFMRVFKEAQKTLVSNALEAETVAEFIIMLAESATLKPWEGTTSEMLGVISGLAGLDDKTPKPEGWPRTPEKLAAILSRLIPALRSEGVHLERLPKTRYARLWRLCMIEAKPSQPSPKPSASSTIGVVDAKSTSDSLGDGLIQQQEAIRSTATKPSSRNTRPTHGGDSGDGRDSPTALSNSPESEVKWHDLD